MKYLKSLAAFAVLSIVLLSSLTSTVHAQQSQSTRGQGNGLKISPVRFDLTIEKGSSQSVTIYLENITGAPINAGSFINDFVPSTDESGEPRIILDEKQSAPGNSFKSIITKPASILIQPNERKEIKATLSVPRDASAGGYYGAVRFAPTLGDNDKSVALSASVGSIFLVRVPGNISEKLAIESFGAIQDGQRSSLFNSGPLAIETRFRNFGNIHVQPFGKVFVKDMSGKVVQEMEINNTQPRGSVLPASIRKFENKIDREKYFGRYTVEGSFGYGTNGELITAKSTFYVIPYKLIAAGIVFIAFLIFGVPRIIGAYNRSVIRKSRSKR